MAFFNLQLNRIITGFVLCVLLNSTGGVLDGHFLHAADLMAFLVHGVGRAVAKGVIIAALCKVINVKGDRDILIGPCACLVVLTFLIGIGDGITCRCFSVQNWIDNHSGIQRIRLIICW